MDYAKEKRDFESFVDTLVLKDFLKESDLEQMFQVWMARAVLDVITADMLRGWSIQWNPHSKHMTVDYNTRTQWEVRRTEAPYSFTGDGVRSWYGVTIEEAWGRAQADFSKYEG